MEISLGAIMWGIGIFFLIVLAFMGARIVRPTENAVIETLGRFSRMAGPGLNIIIPFIENLISIEITEQMVDVEPQKVITKDNLNAEVDALVYYKVKDAKAALYNINDHESQLVALARTTLRSVLGQMTLTEANEKRSVINAKVEEILDKETSSYGVDVLRVEIQKIDPPQDVQESMNSIIKAEQQKIAAKNLAEAAEIKADGNRRAAIKEAEGFKQAAILKAEGEAEAIKLVNDSAEKHFKGNAVELKKLETAERSLAQNAKIIMSSDIVEKISRLSNGLIEKTF